MENKDHPSILLQRYNFIVIKVKPQYKNLLLKPCCYTSENSYKVFKWIPNDPKYDKTNGSFGKKIMKLNEVSGCCMRCLVPSGYRGYDGYYVAEFNRKVVYMVTKPL